MDGNRQICTQVIRFCMEGVVQWDLLRTFEAVARLGSLSSAAKALGQSQSTVSRHIGKLEALSGSPLFLRTNPVKLTERGEALIQAVLPMVSASHEAALAIQDSPKLHGDVTLTTVGEILRWVLCRHLPSFYRDYPHLRLHMLADNRVSSLAQGEADVALRLARPSRGELTARKLHTESYGFYAASSVNLHKDVPWLGLTGSLASIPEQRFADRTFASRKARLLVEDIETLAQSVALGLGVAILSRSVAARLPGLREVLPQQVGGQDLGPIPTRDFWIVVHRRKQRIPKVRAVMTWLLGIPSFDVREAPTHR